MSDSKTDESKDGSPKLVWSAPVIDVFDAKDAETGGDTHAESLATS